jgi:hypothetical protein
VTGIDDRPSTTGIDDPDGLVIPSWDRQAVGASVR